MKNYTVLLLYPDYLSSGGPETYHTYVTNCFSITEAVDIAQREAATENGFDKDEDPADFLPLFVSEGKLENLL